MVSAKLWLCSSMLGPERVAVLESVPVTTHVLVHNGDAHMHKETPERANQTFCSCIYQLGVTPNPHASAEVS